MEAGVKARGYRGQVGGRGAGKGGGRGGGQC